MSEIDGLRTAELIRQLPLHAHTPIVAVTAHIISDKRQRLLPSGNEDVLLDWQLALRQAGNKPNLAWEDAGYAARISARD